MTGFHDIFSDQTWMRYDNSRYIISKVERGKRKERETHRERLLERERESERERRNDRV